MDSDLRAIKAALAQGTDTELRALIGATYGALQIAPGLSAWIEAACYWELYRRRGFDLIMQPPKAAILPNKEDAVGIAATMTMRATFAQNSAAVQALFDALVELLTGGEWKH
jgi:hypothetical protein